MKRYISCKGIQARGRIVVREIVPDTILVAAEVISKSTNIRGIYRYLMLLKGEILLVEDVDEDGERLYTNYFMPTFKITDPSEIKINAMRIRKLAKNGVESPIRMTILVNNQTAGVDGLETITIAGDNIIRGIQTLKDRQEVDIKADALGPWTEIETPSLKLEIGKGIRIKKISFSTIELLSTKVLV
ncbi:MAG TPA: hypothetical protein VJ044_13320 [Candidatus Hodarchaeales archaeon]|nr:hypothetical protein [Candidatus Hodarchaeales archaeon]